METGAPNVLTFPVHRRSTLEDTLSGFARAGGLEPWSGRRIERPVTMALTEIRGFPGVERALGSHAAAGLLEGVLGSVVAVLVDGKAMDLTVAGEPERPVVSWRFEGALHAYRALRTATAVRDAVDRPHPSAGAGRWFQACTGVSSGTIVDAGVGGVAGFAFRAVGILEMFAARLQEFAGPGQIFISKATAEEVGRSASSRSIGDVRINTAGERREAFLLLETSAIPPRAD